MRSGALNLSPLAASVLAMRISDPDVHLRASIVRDLDEVFLPTSDEILDP